MYAALSTRPDIAAPVNMLAKFTNGPSMNQWEAAKRVLLYLKHTAHYRLTYLNDKTTSVGLVGYSDADWASDKEDRKSRSGYCFFLNGCLIDWRSKKQTRMSLSSFESEYAAATYTSQSDVIALVSAMKEEMFLRQTLLGLHTYNMEPTVLYMDNTAAIRNALDPISTEKTKHIAIDLHYIRQQVDLGILIPTYVSTKENIADILTKGLGKELHYKHLNSLGLLPYDALGKLMVIERAREN
jgi:hypothetical protein